MTYSLGHSMLLDCTISLVVHRAHSMINVQATLKVLESSSVTCTAQ